MGEEAVKPDRDWIAWAQMVGADFAEKTLELRVEGDMPPVFRGRYAIVSADTFGTAMMQAKLWRDGQNLTVNKASPKGDK